MRKSRFFTSFLAAMAFSGIEAQIAPAVPKLVVNITIDQLRSDYMEAFLPLYGDKGFRRLLKESRIYSQTKYPMISPDRASAVASIATGTYPYNHGIVGEKWLDRNTLRPIYCVDDKAVKGLYTDESSSPQYLGVSTISDELKVATEGKSIVYSISPFRDASVLSAGHAADAAVWLNDKTGEWCGTTYYGGFPSWAIVQNQYRSLDKKLQSVTWEPSSDLVGTFSYFLSGGMKKNFKHKFKGDRRFRSFKTSGLVNEEVSALASSCIRSTTIGGDAVTDYLSITFYAGNFEHQPVSQSPMELQDTYVRLDKVLGEVIDEIDSKVGIKNAFFVITSTGYNDEESADLSKYKIPTGNFYINRTSALLNMYLMAVYGQGQYVDATFGSQIYLNHKLIETKQLNLADVLERSQDFLIQFSGVKDVYTSQRLQLGAWTPGISAIRNGYHPKCSGDILIQVTNGWRLVNENTQENLLIRETYVPFPIFFFGSAIKPEVIETPVTTECIAPTLAHVMRIRAPNACSVAPLEGVR